MLVFTLLGLLTWTVFSVSVIEPHASTVPTVEPPGESLVDGFHGEDITFITPTVSAVYFPGVTKLLDWRLPSRRPCIPRPGGRTVRYVGEFGYEIGLVLPSAYFLSLHRHLSKTIGVVDTAALYFFSPCHVEVKLRRANVGYMNVCV